MNNETLKLLKSKVTLNSIKELDKAVSRAVRAGISALKPREIVFLAPNNKGRTFDAFYPKNCRLSFFSDEPLLIYLRLHPQIIVRKEIPRILEGNFQDKKLPTKIESKLKKLNINAVVPLFLNNQICGIFLLGWKKINQAQTNGNFNLLKNFQTNVSKALIGVILYKEAIERAVCLRIQ